MDSSPFIVKYAPVYLRDFCCSETRDNELAGQSRSSSYRCVYVLKTLMEMDDMNVLLIGGFNSGKTAMLQGLLREYYGLAKGANFPETNVLSINN